jgi:hypothetical protein
LRYHLSSVLSTDWELFRYVPEMAHMEDFGRDWSMGEEKVEHDGVSLLFREVVD